MFRSYDKVTQEIKEMYHPELIEIIDSHKVPPSIYLRSSGFWERIEPVFYALSNNGLAIYSCDGNKVGPYKAALRLMQSCTRYIDRSGAPTALGLAIHKYINRRLEEMKSEDLSESEASLRGALLGIPSDSVSSSSIQPK
ncbi:hypothetical protein [Legionella yabuuchiae]|uniref:hypothetical protein n=1 Tax=Legionella yabuuchiae TaxID=376727 RepID=UPI0010551F25|nr:hypothetical protein [Legionella yabuuchiae]